MRVSTGRKQIGPSVKSITSKQLIAVIKNVQGASVSPAGYRNEVCSVVIDEDISQETVEIRCVPPVLHGVGQVPLMQKEAGFRV